MGRLKGRGLPSRLSRKPGRLARPEKTSEPNHRRSKNWLNTTRWQNLRLRILERDEWTCRQTGVLLVGGRDAPNSAVVDHIVPHRGDETLFWNEDNLQSVAKAWHDAEKQRRERNGLA